MKTLYWDKMLFSSLIPSINFIYFFTCLIHILVYLLFYAGRLKSDSTCSFDVNVLSKRFAIYINIYKYAQLTTYLMVGLTK